MVLVPDTIYSPFSLNERTSASYYFITFNYFISRCSLLVMFLCKQTHYDYDYDYDFQPRDALVYNFKMYILRSCVSICEWRQRDLCVILVL